MIFAYFCILVAGYPRPKTKPQYASIKPVLSKKGGGWRLSSKHVQYLFDLFFDVWAGLMNPTLALPLCDPMGWLWEISKVLDVWDLVQGVKSQIMNAFFMMKRALTQENVSARVHRCVPAFKMCAASDTYLLNGCTLIKLFGRGLPKQVRINIFWSDDTGLVG